MYQPTREQLKNGFFLSVATVFAIAGAGILSDEPVLGTTFLLLGVTIIFIREALKKI
jgi:hypothetical protein